MSELTLPDYQQATSTLESSSLSVTPAEMHGLLVGMLAGGITLDDNSWQPLIFDYTNQGMGWPQKSVKLAQEALSVSISQLTGTQLELSMLLAEETDLLARAESLSEWVNHFISGLGLAGLTLKKIPADIKEAMTDLEEIGKLGIDEDDDLQEQAVLLEQVIEHVKACVLTIHAEFGVKPTAEKSTPTIH